MILLAFLAQTLRIATPYFFAAAGGVLSERAGVIALTLEGFMLTGAFCAAMGALERGSSWVGLLAGALGGTLAASLYGVAAIHFKADQVVSGIAANLLALGATRSFLRLLYDSSSNSPRAPGFGGAPGAGTGLLAALGSPVVWLGLLALPVLGWVLYRTPYGVRTRAVGEHPEAARSAGVSVTRLRWLGVMGSGALAGLAGVYLALDQHQFTD
ncbi:MAG TPA: ABC transporter permease, partial [Gemmatimonadaceae bacterium]|nr:ABC transporter permease [Gemmatimonadaceae bacterium]